MIECGSPQTRQGFGVLSLVCPSACVANAERFGFSRDFDDWTLSGALGSGA